MSVLVVALNEKLYAVPRLNPGKVMEVPVVDAIVGVNDGLQLLKMSYPVSVDPFVMAGGPHEKDNEVIVRPETPIAVGEDNVATKYVVTAYGDETSTLRIALFNVSDTYRYDPIDVRK
jgi:hypothetical protein